MNSNNEVLAAVATNIATFIQTNETEKQLEECLFSISEMDDIFVLYILNILNRKRAISNFDLRQKISGYIDTVYDKTPSEFRFHFRLIPLEFEVSTVKPLNSGHSRDRPNCPLLRGVCYWEKLIK